MIAKPHSSIRHVGFAVFMVEDDKQTKCHSLRKGFRCPVFFSLAMAFPVPRIPPTGESLTVSPKTIGVL